MSRNLDLSAAFPVTRQGLRVLGMQTTEVKCHFHYISRMYCQHDVVGHRDTWLEAVFVSLPHCRAPFPLLSILYFWEGRRYVCPKLRKKLCSTPRGYLQCLEVLHVRDFSVLPQFIYFFSHLCVPVDSWVFIVCFEL